MRFLKQHLKNGFPGQGEEVFDAQTKVSRIPLIIASYQNATWDFTLYSEGFLTVLNSDGKRYVGLIPLAEMANKQPMDPAYMSISEYLETEDNVPVNKISPHATGRFYRFILQGAPSRKLKILKPKTMWTCCTKYSDIKTWANLGMYFSNKLRAAVEYKRFTLSR